MINRDERGRLRRLGILCLAAACLLLAPAAGADGWSRLHLPLLLRRARIWPATPTRTPTRTQTSASPPPPTLTFTPTNTATPSLTRTPTRTPTRTGTSVSPPPPTLTLTPTRTATPSLTPTPTATPTSDGCAWFDSFYSATLNAAWGWVRQDPARWSLTARPGYLRISAGPGELVGTAGVPNNLMLRAASGDWEIVTRVLFDPQQNVQQAALVAYQDDDHFVAVQRMYYYGDLVGLFAESGAEAFSAVVETDLDAIVLKLAKTGAVYTGSFSADGVVWFPIGAASDVALSNVRVGLGAWSGPAAEGASSINADFDWFCYDQ